MVYVCIKRTKQKEYFLFMAYLFLNRNMFSKIITLFILLCFIANTILNKKLKERCYLPSGCEFGPQSKDQNTIIRINCYDPLVKYDFSLFNRSNEMCRLKQPTRRIIFMSIRANRKNSILDIKLDLLKLVEYSMLYFKPYNVFLQYYNFKGIRVDTKIELNISITTTFYQTKLYFYDQHNQLINDCDSFERNNGEFKDFLNPKKIKNLFLIFNIAVYKTPVCEAFFRNSKFERITFNDLFNTYLKNNMVKIIQKGSRSEWLNSTINTLEINGYEIDLSRKILNENVFK